MKSWTVSFVIVGEEGINELGKPKAADEARRTQCALASSAFQKVPHKARRVQGKLAELVSKYLEPVKAANATCSRKEIRCLSMVVQDNYRI